MISSKKKIIEAVVQKARQGGWDSYVKPPVFPIKKVKKSGEGWTFLDANNYLWNLTVMFRDLAFPAALWGDEANDRMEQMMADVDVLDYLDRWVNGEEGTADRW